MCTALMCDIQQHEAGLHIGNSTLKEKQSPTCAAAKGISE